MISKCTKLFLCSALLTHVLACLLIMSGDGFLAQYHNVDGSIGRQYLAATYWAVTTMTTVGYGDITPSSDVERVYCILTMAGGVGFFAYYVGSVTAVITSQDLNSGAYLDRLEAIQSWLDFHHEIPKQLRRKIRRHFKEHLKQEAAVDDASVFNDLSPELLADTSKFVIHDVIRYHPIFKALHAGAIHRLALILKKKYAVANELIVASGAVGTGMYIIVSGAAVWERSPVRRELMFGDSFGEEILLKREENYTYDVTATTALEAMYISEELFDERFQSMPQVVDEMGQLFDEYNSRKSGEAMAPTKCAPGRSSVLGTMNSLGLPAGFTDVVLDGIHDISRRLASIEKNCAIGKD